MHKVVRHFATDVLSLKEDLQLIQPNYDITVKLVAQVKMHIKQSKTIKPQPKKLWTFRRPETATKSLKARVKKVASTLHSAALCSVVFVH